MNHKVSKQELIEQLKLLFLNFEFGLASLSLINDPYSLKMLPQLKVKFGSYEHSHDRVISILENDTDKAVAINNFLKRSLLCATLKDYFDAIELYCDKTQSDQHDMLKKEPYYQYIRVIRNTMSHGYKFNFKKMNKKIFPIHWNGKNIDLSDEYKEITDKILDVQDVFILIDRLNSFVINLR